MARSLAGWSSRAVLWGVTATARSLASGLALTVTAARRRPALTVALLARALLWSAGAALTSTLPAVARGAITIAQPRLLFAATLAAAAAFTLTTERGLRVAAGAVTVAAALGLTIAFTLIG